MQVRAPFPISTRSPAVDDSDSQDDSDWLSAEDMLASLSQAFSHELDQIEECPPGHEEMLALRSCGERMQSARMQMDLCKTVSVHDPSRVVL